jgi:hypothetical protein
MIKNDNMYSFFEDKMVTYDAKEARIRTAILKATAALAPSKK